MNESSVDADDLIPIEREAQNERERERGAGSSILVRDNELDFTFMTAAKQDSARFIYLRISLDASYILFKILSKEFVP